MEQEKERGRVSSVEQAVPPKLTNKVQTEMERGLASRDEEIGQLQVQNKELIDKQKDFEAKMEQIIQEKERASVSSVEQAAQIETLQEDLQVKNQQVKQYKRQVDAVKADLGKCREKPLLVEMDTTC